MLDHVSGDTMVIDIGHPILYPRVGRHSHIPTLLRPNCSPRKVRSLVTYFQKYGFAS